MGQSEISRRNVAAGSHRLAVLGHELANVLTGLSGAAGMLRASRLDADQERWLDAIESSTAQLEFLVRSARKGSAADDPTDGIEKRRLNGVRFLEQLVTAHSPAASEKGIRLLLAIDPRLPANWHCSGGLLRQVLDNLLGNAVKYNRDGDVRISARALPGDTLSVSVADNGPGIETSKLECIFEAYRRGQVTSQTTGRGLGLHVCRHITEELGGTIRCRSLRGRGAEFTVDLPGVLEVRSPPRAPSVALATVQCMLDIDDALAEVTGMLLDRLGVSWCRKSSACREPDSAGLSILVRSAAGQDEGCHGTAILQPLPGNPAVLTGGMLPSTLEAALLRLVLEWRWGRLSRDDMPG